MIRNIEIVGSRSSGKVSGGHNHRCLGILKLWGLDLAVNSSVVTPTGDWKSDFIASLNYATS